MKPQPILDTDGFWQWKDCQWLDSGIGMPESGIKDHAPYAVGDRLRVREAWQDVNYLATVWLPRETPGTSNCIKQRGWKMTNAELIVLLQTYPDDA
jgi:hypothetical protein